MIAEAINRIKDLVGASKEVTIEKIEGAPAGTRIIKKGDGTHELLRLDPAPRTMTTTAIEDLVRVALEHFDGDVAKAERMLVVYGPNFAELIFDHKRADERYRWTTDYTEESLWFYFLLERLISNRNGDFDEQCVTLTVDEAVELFDCKLRMTRPDMGTIFLPSISKLKVVTEKVHEQERTANSSLTGGLATKKIANDEGLPEGVQTFKVRPFVDGVINGRLPIDVYLRPNLNSPAWSFMVVEDSYHQFSHAAAELIGNFLRNGLKESPEIKVVRADFRQKHPA